MANYLDGMEGGKHNSDNIETSTKSSSYTVSITFECVGAKNPLEAAKIVAKWLVEDDEHGNAFDMVYEVNDEITNEKFIVDLDADDDYAVLPNN